MNINPFLLCDFYKIDHRRQYPNNTNFIYSNFTPRQSRTKSKGIIFFGLQAFIQEFLIKQFNENFFKQDKQILITEYKQFIKDTLQINDFDTSHIEALHDLGYLPLEIKALPEGAFVPCGVPCLTIKNTHPAFAWLVNFVETLMSSELWKPCTSATTAYQYRQILDKYADISIDEKDKWFVDYQAHDFSFRGMSGMRDAMLSGMGHLQFFKGTDTIPAILGMKEYYNIDISKAGYSSVPACYDRETEVLTEFGFVKFSDLNKNVKVAQYNNGEIEFVVPTQYYAMPYKGEMIQWKNTGYDYVDLLVTPNHKMVTINKNKEISLFEAGNFDHKYDNKNYFLVSGMIKDNNEVSSELTIIQRLQIAFQADGSLPNRSDSYHSGQFRFSLKKDRKIERLEKFLKEENLKYTISEKDKRGYVNFWVNPDNKVILSKNFNWVEISKISVNWCKQFIEELSYWDGYKPQNRNCIIYSNTNLEAINKIQEICCLGGMKSYFSSRLDKRTDYNRKILYSLVIQNKTYIWGNKIVRNIIEYNDFVYCVSVPSKMLIVRRNNKVAICGNTEHSVMCAGGKENEKETYKRLITEVYPSGIVSIVSDTWDLWNVLTNILPNLKEEILARDGKVVIRPDSGDPVDIICGDFHMYRLRYMKEQYSGKTIDVYNEEKGVIEILWDTFGGYINEKGYKVLNPKIGTIYGDSITLERAEEICKRLIAKGFSTHNIVFGIGSYTYQYVTRDTYGFAMKATYCEIEGEPKELFKDPITKGDASKKSAKGLLKVEKDDGLYKLIDQCSAEEESTGELKIVFNPTLI